MAGVVTDATGAAVPSAAITAHRVETGVNRKTRTDASGVYDVPLLLPGTYEVTVEAAGMDTMTRPDIKLEVNSTVTIDFTLQVGTVATAVIVNQRNSRAANRNQRSRNHAGNAAGAGFPAHRTGRHGPGAREPRSDCESGGGAGEKQPERIRFGVLRSRRTNFDERGAAGRLREHDRGLQRRSGRAAAGLGPGVPRGTSSYSAEFGRSGGGTVNIVTRSGTNAYHGTAYDYHQNEDLNAYSFTNNRNHLARPFLRRHQYGYSLGGPAGIPMLYRRRNKTFFFSASKDAANRIPSTS